MNKCHWTKDDECKWGFTAAACEDCEIFEPADATHEMIGCSEECLDFACCDFCKYVIHDFWFEQGKDDKWHIMNGGPVGCALHKDRLHQDIAIGCAFCEDFHCFNASDDSVYRRKFND